MEFWNVSKVVSLSQKFSWKKLLGQGGRVGTHANTSCCTDTGRTVLLRQQCWQTDVCCFQAQDHQVSLEYIDRARQSSDVPFTKAIQLKKSPYKENGFIACHEKILAFYFKKKKTLFKGDDCRVCTTSNRFAVQKYISVSDVEVLVYYRAHFNAVIINIAKVVLCWNMTYILLIVCVTWFVWHPLHSG